jgi:4-amino-4-deoxy-L-arabinose transferase-like glycosyltransferase
MGALPHGNRSPAKLQKKEKPRERLFFWCFAALSALLVLLPLRTGDLTGYDDAHFAHMAKDMVATGDWLNLRSNGAHVLEHPPLFVWMQAALFRAFHRSDAMARLPAALCGWGVILLVYALARYLLHDAIAALLAMFVMATSVYFLKYSARAMTDVPFTFLCLCALGSWLRAEENPRWYLWAGVFTGLAQLTRGLAGAALPIAFLIDAIWHRRRPSPRYLATALGLAFLPLLVWYAHTVWVNRATFVADYGAWLDREAFGALSPSWRRYTGVFEYAWMLAKSYWPWLPFMLVGLLSAIRSGDRRWRLLVVWIAVVFFLCAATKSRVLRYLLPAYPAFSILAGVSLIKLLPPRHISASLRLATGILAAMALGIALFPRAELQAAEIRPLAAAATAATPPGERVAFYDSGQPRLDEANQLQWYGDRYLDIMTKPEQLGDKLRDPQPQVFIVDRDTYHRDFALLPHRLVLESGHLICFRLLP